MATTVSHPIPTAQAQAIADLTGYEDAATLRWQQACVQAANQLTALPNGRYVNVRMERMRQGLELAQRGAVSLPEDGEELSAVVRSGNNMYQVDTRLLTCPCADYQKHLQACKHLLAAEIHLGALGLVPPDGPAPAAAEEPAPVRDPAPMAPAPSPATCPISEAPASLNIKLKIGNMELMFTMRDVDDLKLQRRATMSLPWLQDILHGCEANLAARQQEASPARTTTTRAGVPRTRSRCAGMRATPAAPAGLATSSPMAATAKANNHIPARDAHRAQERRRCRHHPFASHSRQERRRTNSWPRACPRAAPTASSTRAGIARAITIATTRSTTARAASPS